MNKSSNLRTGRTCVFLMHVHLVFVTKYRKKIFTKEILQDLENIFKKVCTDFETELSEFNGEGDHVHLLINYPPKIAISKLVNSLKEFLQGYCAKKIIQLFKTLWGNHLWSPSYFESSCGGAPLEVLKDYIEEQKSPD